MKTNKYEHYFDIDEEFFSAVNQELINEGKVDWRKFFPHETFVKLLKDINKTASFHMGRRWLRNR